MDREVLPASARIARRILKFIALPLLVLAAVVRFTIPPSTWWLDYTFLALLPFVIILWFIARVPWRNSGSSDS
jgi:hypothetical protein